QQVQKGQGGGESAPRQVPAAKIDHPALPELAELHAGAALAVEHGFPVARLPVDEMAQCNPLAASSGERLKQGAGVVAEPPPPAGRSARKQRQAVPVFVSVGRKPLWLEGK